MSVEDIRSKFSIKSILSIIGKTNYNAINELREALYANASAIPTTLEEGCNGHIGLPMDALVYSKVSTTS